MARPATGNQTTRARVVLIGRENKVVGGFSCSWGGASGTPNRDVRHFHIRVPVPELKIRSRSIR